MLIINDEARELELIFQNNSGTALVQTEFMSLVVVVVVMSYRGTCLVQDQMHMACSSLRQ